MEVERRFGRVPLTDAKQRLPATELSHDALRSRDRLALPWRRRRRRLALRRRCRLRAPEQKQTTTTQ
jgi:hypothetical protein